MQQGNNLARKPLPWAVVAGAGALGLAICRRLGQSHQILVADNDPRQLEAACASLRDEGHTAEGAPCDITSSEAVASLAAYAQSLGQVQTLAHVAALSLAAQSFDAILSVNIAGAARMAAAFESVLQCGGCAVFISSSSAHMGVVDEATKHILDAPLGNDFIDVLRSQLPDGGDTPAAAYMLSKLALNRMCVRLAPGWGARGLRIVSLSPGLIATPMGAEAYKHSAQKRRLRDAIPLGREGSALEISAVVAFLASADASYITGTDILVDGGLISGLQRAP